MEGVCGEESSLGRWWGELLASHVQLAVDAAADLSLVGGGGGGVEWEMHDTQSLPMRSM